MRTNLLLGFLSATLTLLAVGGALELRLRHESTARRAEMFEKHAGRERCIRKAALPELIYERIPGACGANSMGFFDREHALAQKNGVKRILVIGDSVAEGRPKYSFVGNLQALLDERFGEGAWEVIKLAVSGYSTSQELVLFREYGLRYSPDLVIWSYVLNDPAHPVFHNANAEMGRFYYQPSSHFLHDIQRRLFFLRQRIWSKWRDCPSEYHHLMHCVYWDEVVDNFGRIAALGHECGAPVVLAIHPVFQKEGWEHYSLTEVHRKLEQAARSAGLEVVDLLGPLSRHPVDQLRNPDSTPEWYDPWHPNREGHEVIARGLFSYLTTNPSTAKLFDPGL